jgi:hypothetical protein
MPSSSPAPTAGGTAAAIPKQPPTIPSGNFNPYDVKGQTPEELVSFLREMAVRRPNGTT